MRKQMARAVCAVVLLFAAFSLPAQDRGRNLLSQGITAYNKGAYGDALQAFRQIVLDSSLDGYHGDGYFWIAKNYIALGQLDEAERNLEFYILNFRDNRYYPESKYQKGRLLYLQREYEDAILAMNEFLETEKDSPYIANGYFWIGESLYALGHFDEASKVYGVILSRYPNSFKVEAARYRISLIELKDREQELLKLLKWSHEESLKTIEDFQRRERTYEQALQSYQRKLSALSGSGVSAEVSPSSDSSKDDEIAAYKRQINSLLARIETLESAGPVVSGAEVDPEIRAQIEATRKLLALKAKALEVKAAALRGASDAAAPGAEE